MTTIPTLAAMVRAIGGDRVRVRSLAGPRDDPHYVDARPSFALALHRADLLVLVGVGLESGWLPVLVRQARNPRIRRGQVGYLDVSEYAGPLLERGGDRRSGDVHPGGNPHFLYHPDYGIRVARAIAARLQRLAPRDAPLFRQRLQAFAERVRRVRDRWRERLAPWRGQPVVGYHKSLAYLVRWLGLRPIGFVEPYPGIAPSPRHLAELVLLMRQEGARLILMEPWYDARTARLVAQKAAGTIARLPGDVGSDGIRSYEQLLEHIASSIEQGLRRAYGG